MGTMGNVRFNSGLVLNPHDAGVKEMSEFKLSRRSLDRLEGVDERLVAVVKHAITATKTDFGVIQGFVPSSSRKNWSPRAQP